MAPRVAIWQSDCRGYSDAWLNADEFPEKEALRALSALLKQGSDNMFVGRVFPGQRVVVKPNWVLSFHPLGHDLFSVVTHSAVVRAVVDLVFEAMNGKGEIVIADAPQFNASFDRLMAITQAPEIASYYRRRHGVDIPIFDLRQIALAHEDSAFIRAQDRRRLAGDPRGYSVVSLGEKSAFVGLANADRIYGADYDRRETTKHHNAERHEYLVSRTILEADAVVHVPKLKTHKKVGITINAKGMVGINGNKNWIAHYRVGSPASGGDEFPGGTPLAGRLDAALMRWGIDRLLVPESRWGEIAYSGLVGARSLAARAVRRLGRSSGQVLGNQALRGGNWYGNDTAWRMTVDLARVVRFSDVDGRLHGSPQRQFLSVVDGVVAGEGEGPLAPSPKQCGVLIAGTDLLAVDLACARLMGYDWRRVPYLRWLVEDSRERFEVDDPKDVEVVSNVEPWRRMMVDEGVPDLAFEVHPGWRGQIELTPGRRPQVSPAPDVVDTT